MPSGTANIVLPLLKISTAEAPHSGTADIVLPTLKISTAEVEMAQSLLDTLFQVMTHYTPPPEVVRTVWWLCRLLTGDTPSDPH